jgi:hypothetical protein
MLNGAPIQKYRITANITEEAAAKDCKNISGGKGVLQCDYPAK